MTAKRKSLSAMIPAAKDMLLLRINGAKKSVPPKRSTNLGDGNQLFAMTLWLYNHMISFFVKHSPINLHLPVFEQYQQDIKQMHHNQIAMGIQT